MWSLIVVVYESEIDQEILYICSRISLFIGVAFLLMQCVTVLLCVSHAL